MELSGLRTCSPAQLLEIKKICSERLKTVKQKKEEEFQKQTCAVKIWLIVSWKAKVFYYSLFDRNKYESLMEVQKVISQSF